MSSCIAAHALPKKVPSDRPNMMLPAPLPGYHLSYPSSPFPSKHKQQETANCNHKHTHTHQCLGSVQLISETDQKWKQKKRQPFGVLARQRDASRRKLSGLLCTYASCQTHHIWSHRSFTIIYGPNMIKCLFNGGIELAKASQGKFIGAESNTYVCKTSVLNKTFKT